VKKLLSFILVVVSLLIVGCESDSTSSNENSYSNGVFVVNDSGEFGTISVIDNGEISNDVVNVGKVPNDAKVVDDRLYVLSAGTSDIRIYDISDLSEIGAITLTEGLNPEKMEINGDKIYVSYLFSSDIEIYSLSTGEKTGSIPLDGGMSGADIMIRKDSLLYVNRNNYSFGKGSYEDEMILKVNMKTDEVIDSVLVGVNIGAMTIVSDTLIHVLCGGNYGDINGEIRVINLKGGLYHDSMELLEGDDEKFEFDFQINHLVKGKYGYIYTAKTDYDEAWNPESALMKYNPYSMEMINDADNPIFTTDSGILGMHYSNELIYLPLFNSNSLIVFKDDAKIEEYTTGVGPKLVVSK
jgi:hypothetical protein